MNHMKVKKILGICTDGLPFVGLCITLASLFLWRGMPLIGWIWVGCACFCAWFFRDPDRIVPDKEGTVTSPADGKIIAIEKAPYPYLIEGEALKVSIFMNVFNVHVNRSPVDGEVVGLKYFEGKFMGAFKDKASLENEQMGLLIKAHGQSILCIQIAGLIARRIICRVKSGEHLKRGQRFGLIRFGSRVDLYLPLDCDIKVEMGQVVSAGSSVIGTL